jgi:hypothetical protein
MDRSRKATRESNESTLQHKSQQDASLTEEMIEDKLAQLQASIDELRQTAVYQQRVKIFGECKRIEGETSGEFYEKLRRWLDREMPQTKSPRHPPRQTGPSPP